MTSIAKFVWRGMVWGGALLGLALQPLVAHAVLTDNLTIGNAKALALGHAVTADPPGIDSVHFNPAGLARLDGRQAEIKVVSGAFDVELIFGDHYSDSWTAKLEQAQEGSPADFTYDEALGQTSNTEGAAVMLPFFGMTELPTVLSALGGASYSPPDSKVTFATNVYAPLMVGFSRSDTDPGRFVGKALSFTLITYFSPSVAYQVTDTLALGASVSFNYAGVGLNLEFREPNLGLQWLEQIRQGSCDQDAGGIPNNWFDFSDLIPCVAEENAIKLYDAQAFLEFEVEQELTFGVNFGVLWEAQPWLHLGAVYQSPIRMDMEGDFTWTQGKDFLHFLQEFDKISPVPLRYLGPLASLVDPQTKGTVTLDMTMPEHFAVGSSLQVTPQLKVNTDLKYTRWSRWDKLPVKYSEPLGVLVITSFVQPEGAPQPIGKTMNLEFGLEDTWNLALGFEYQWDDRLALRMGIEDRPSSIPPEHRSPVLPIGDTRLYSIGAEYKPSANQVLNFAIANMRSSTFMPANTSTVGNSEDPMLLIYNPYSGNDIEANLDVILLEGSYRYYW